VSLLIRDVGRLVSYDDAAPVADAALVLDGGVVAWSGPSSAAPACDEVLSAGGGCVVPGFVDSHTHLVFGGDRVEEFTARLAGIPYAAGGIRTTVAATRAASTPALLASARRLADEALRSGTTTLEVKSGYGLTVEDERRSLDVAATVARHRTFLGAHVVPEELTAPAYVELVVGPMLDVCAPLATAVDAFCEEGAFDAEQCRAVLAAGAARGLDVHVHANQLRPGPGAQLAASLGAASADHCTHLTDADVGALRDAGVVAVLVPAAEFSTRSPYAPARRLLDAGVTVALATDCNPGTSYTTSMPFVIALACRELGLTPTEAVRAATLGGAAALRDPTVGHLRVGARADLVVLDAPSEDYLAYRPGVDLVKHVVRDGVKATTPPRRSLRSRPGGDPE
jgi:imidazolonepropionase